ncbi:hypothetical protein, partial [Pleomorphomonas koreensis]|uniref:hypothetical protein n=1 Tax=Pleomorphomonas koreensis TaxID=257440 RepID=UPI001AEBFCED
MDTGVPSPNLPRATTSESLLVNSPAGTSRQTVQDLALQLVSSEPMRLATMIGSLYRTEADLPATTAQVTPWVWADPDPEKIGIYDVVDGLWAKALPLPYSIIPAEVDDGDAVNARRLTTRLPLYSGVAVIIPVVGDNTASPVTASFDGGETSRTIKTASGGDVPEGSLTAGMKLIGMVQDTTIHLVSDASYDAVMQERLAATTQAKSDALTARAVAQIAAGNAGQSATDAATYAGAAATTLATVIASAEAGGQARIFDTKAAATAAISTIADQEVVEVLIDETSGGGRTRYRKQSGSLVFKLRLDETWDKLIEKIAETGEDIIGQALAELPAIATNRYTGRSLKDRFSDVVSIMDCGAVPGDDDAHAVANDLAFTKAISKLSHGSVLIIPDLGMPFVIGHMVSVNIGYVRIACFGKLKASASFTDPYMWSNDTSADRSESTWYCAPILVDMLNLDCAYKTRGLYQYKLDHQTLDSARVERAFGNAIYIDRMRESTIYSPTIIEAKARQRFSNPAQWLAGTTYAVGDRVRAVNAAWDSATAYPQGDIVEYGGGRYISRKASTNQAPGSDFASWQPIPFEDYECVISGTGKNPFTYNTNSSISGNRYWKKVYQDEAALEIVDSVQDNADRSNGNHIYTPVIRDCANMCLMRVDSNKSGPAFGPLSVHGGHIHDIVQGASSYPADLAGAETTPMRRVLEIGYAFAVAFYGTQLRASDANSSIVVLIGDGGATKFASFVSFLEGSISSGGSGAVGILIMPSVTNQSIKSTSRMLVGNGGTDALPIL